MRKAIRELEGVHAPNYPNDAHAGLVYDRLAPITTDPASDDFGKVSITEQSQWYRALEGIKVGDAYSQAFERWKKSLHAHGATFTYTVEAVSRLLIGHGNPSASEVGLTVHHTWGTPILSGSSLKGLLQHALVKKYGPRLTGEPLLHPLDEKHSESDRSTFQPVAKDGNAIKHGPGDAIRWLFGSPAAQSDADMNKLFPVPDGEAPRAGERRGELYFMDAWMVPPTKSEPKTPYVRDVLTVHQKSYYGQGQSSGERSMPNDYDSPNPVNFLTIRPGTKFLLAVSGTDAAGKRFALNELSEALESMGIGGKTSAGYGRMVVLEGETIYVPKAVVKSDLLDDVIAILQEHRDSDIRATGPQGNVTWRDRLKHIIDVMGTDIRNAPDEVRAKCAKRIRDKKKKWKKAWNDASAFADEIDPNA